MAYVNKAREGREFWNRLCTLPRYMFLLMPSGKGVQKLEDRCGNWIDVHDAQKIVDDAQAELAALQEELSTSKRNEHNSEVAYKAAIEKQEELRDRKNSIVDLQQRLTAAEQRYAPLMAFANELTSAAFEGGSFDGGDIQDIAVKHGLMRIESRGEECGEVCACREYGFPAECYRKTELFKPTESAEEKCTCWLQPREPQCTDCPNNKPTESGASE